MLEVRPCSWLSDDTRVIENGEEVTVVHQLRGGEWDFVFEGVHYSINREPLTGLFAHQYVLYDDSSLPTGVLETEKWKFRWHEFRVRYLHRKFRLKLTGELRLDLPIATLSEGCFELGSIKSTGRFFSRRLVSDISGDVPLPARILCMTALSSEFDSPGV